MRTAQFGAVQWCQPTADGDGYIGNTPTLSVVLCTTAPPRGSQRVGANIINIREEMSESFFFSLLSPVKVTSVDFKGEGSPKIGDSRRGDRAAGGKKKASEKKKDSGMIAVYQKTPLPPAALPAQVKNHPAAHNTLHTSHITHHTTRAAGVV